MEIDQPIVMRTLATKSSNDVPANARSDTA
jgi:hypothetical protein